MMEDYEVAGQFTLFDLMPTPDINDVTEEEAVKIVGDRLGIEFKYNAFFKHWEGRVGKLVLSLNYSHFVLDDNHNLFLAVDYRHGTSGGGCPCDGIDEAVDWCRWQIERWNGKGGNEC